jgi:hypothetical protein
MAEWFPGVGEVERTKLQGEAEAWHYMTHIQKVERALLVVGYHSHFWGNFVQDVAFKLAYLAEHEGALRQQQRREKPFSVIISSETDQNIIDLISLLLHPQTGGIEVEGGVRDEVSRRVLVMDGACLSHRVVYCSSYYHVRNLLLIERYPLHYSVHIGVPFPRGFRVLQVCPKASTRNPRP